MGGPSNDKGPATAVDRPYDVQEGIVVEGGELLDGGLKRALKQRHVTLISLSSVIGAGAFYAFGYALYLSGPIGALIGFGITGECIVVTIPRRAVEIWETDAFPGFVVWALMQSIGEVTTMFPVAGGFIEVR